MSVPGDSIFPPPGPAGVTLGFGCSGGLGVVTGFEDLCWTHPTLIVAHESSDSELDFTVQPLSPSRHRQQP